MRSLKKALMIVLVIAIILSVIHVSADSGSMVYVRKHVSILYDDSASMRLPLTSGDPNLKWCYASYAAQAFTGLLNDADTLDITLMNGAPLHNIDLANDRQASVDRVLAATSVAVHNTPISKIAAALRVLTNRGLKEGSGENDPGEQFWLVLMTDGVFTDENNNDCSVETIVNELDSVMTMYPDVRLVYFGIGTPNEADAGVAIDFRPGHGVNSALLDRLYRHYNFNAVYSRDQEDIVQTMQELSNLIAGRYSVTDNCDFNGNEVVLHISRESSAIRNMAILAQKTNARLVSVSSSEQNDIELKRDVQIRYPYNPSYSNLPENTMGGYVALVAANEGESLPAGDITLVFSEPVSPGEFSLMYEPAIHIDLRIERMNENGEWTELDRYRDPVIGDRIRIIYNVCEDGTGTVCDLNSFPGAHEESIRYNGRQIQPGEVIEAEEGDASIEVDISMMDGDYRLGTQRTIHIAAPSPEDYAYRSSGPIELVRADAAENTEKFIEFTAGYNGMTPDADFMNKLKITAEGENGARLAGETELAGGGVIRFTPKDPNCKAGEYTVRLLYEKNEVCSERCTILPNETYYTAESGAPLSITNNRLGDNSEYLYFTVTAHTDEGDRPIDAEESSLFRIAAEGGKSIAGTTDFLGEGRIAFTPKDASLAPGDYTIALYKDDQLLARSSLSVINYDAHYTVEVVVSNPDTVNRFALQKNEANVAFIVYEDGAPCSAAQLEAMLGSQIKITSSPNSPYMRLETEVKQVNGKTAVVCTPKSSTRSGLIRFFHHIGTAVSPGGLSADKLGIDIKVDMLHGCEAGGELDLIGSGVPYVVFLFVLAGLLAILGIWFFASGKVIRFKKGTIYSCLLSEGYRDGARTYSISLSSRKVGKGMNFNLVPINETASCGGMSFVTGDSFSEKTWRRRVVPEAVIDGDQSSLDNYCSGMAFYQVTELLDQISSGAISDELSENEFETICDGMVGLQTQALNFMSLEEEEEDEDTTLKVSLSDTVLRHEEQTGTRSEYRLWWFKQQ